MGTESAASWTVEPMQPSDGPAVCAIYGEVIDSKVVTFERAAPTWAAWDRSHRPDCRFVARAADGRVLGWIALSPYSSRSVYDGVAELSVHVASDARGGGVGTALMQHLIAASEAAGIWTLQAGIVPTNVASIRLHESCGFRRVGVRERLGRDAFDRWTDVILFERRSSVVGTD